MPRPKTSTTKLPGRRPANVTLPEDLLQAARTLGINVSQACELGLAREVKQCKQRAWLLENRAAIDAWNDHVEASGLPLAAFRQF
jgi:antitoxin CcdA